MNRFKKTDTRTNRVEVDIIDKHKDYQLKQYPFRKIGKSKSQQTYLTIATLKPKIKSWPKFIFRWDEKAYHLNVDIKNVSNDVKQMFEHEKKGYKGHLPKPVYDCKGKRIFEALIETPKRKIFQGRIIFGLRRGLQASVVIKSSLNASLERKSK